VFLAFVLLRSVWELVSVVYLRPNHPMGLAIRAAPIPFLAAFTYEFLKSLPVFVFVILADEIRGPPLLKVIAVCTALVAGSLVPRPMLCMVAPQFDRFGCMDMVPGPFSVASNVFICGMVVLGYYGWRHARRVRAALQEAEGAAVRSRRRRLEEELQGLQARVEPSLLVDTLERVRQAYDEGVEHGDRLMDTLTFYLRAAVPEKLGEGCTYAHEVDLLRAWLELRGARIGPGLLREIEPALAEVRMPPMVLVPLARNLAQGGRGTFDIEARLVGDRVRVFLSAWDVQAGPRRAAADPELGERLASLYGERTSLDVASREDGAITATLEIPHERIEGGDRGGRGEPARAVA
jgi:hypothetical protein